MRTEIRQKRTQGTKAEVEGEKGTRNDDMHGWSVSAIWQGQCSVGLARMLINLGQAGGRLATMTDTASGSDRSHNRGQPAWYPCLSSSLTAKSCWGRAITPIVTAPKTKLIVRYADD
jgi:hypothetical protein